jgi:polyisoprenoid-binding protein YceI
MTPDAGGEAGQFGIVYAVDKCELAGDRAQAVGTMTIQGKSQPLTLPVVVKSSGSGVSLEGETRLDMTAYGVQPPVVMLGMLKVGPQIRIEFKGLVTP